MPSSTSSTSSDSEGEGRVLICSRIVRSSKAQGGFDPVNRDLIDIGAQGTLFFHSSFYYRKSVLLHSFGSTDKCYYIDDDLPLKQIGFLQ